MHNPQAIFALTLVLTTAAIPTVCHAVDSAITQEHALGEEIDAAERALEKAMVRVNVSAFRNYCLTRMPSNMSGT